ncbi:MAG: hypothetical protein ACLFPQ_04540 [Candidatus Woesearchaeota archaeon]
MSTLSELGIDHSSLDKLNGIMLYFPEGCAAYDSNSFIINTYPGQEERIIDAMERVAKKQKILNTIRNSGIAISFGALIAQTLATRNAMNNGLDLPNFMAYISVISGSGIASTISQIINQRSKKFMGYLNEEISITRGSERYDKMIAMMAIDPKYETALRSTYQDEN